MIDVDALTKLYGDLAAVDKLSFQVGAGEVLGLVGPNGAGKTTTLRALAGIGIPTSGRIRIDGHDMGTHPTRAKAALAFIPDEPQLFEYLTVDEHLLFIGRLYGVPDITARMTPLLEELELSGKRNAFPAELSRGMKQKLAIACGLVHDPRALILDEPLTGLDPVGIRRMRATIAERARAGAAVILSSHLLHLVEELCDRVLVMQNGKRVAYGSIEDIASSVPSIAGQGLEDVFIALTSRGDGGAPKT